MRINPKRTSMKAIKRKLAKDANKKSAANPPTETTSKDVGATYDERIAPKKREAALAGIETFVEDVRGAQEDLNSSVEFGISAVNKMASAGKKWQAFSDRNQFDMGFYNSMETLVKDADRKYVTPNIVTTALHLANVVKKPVKTVQEASEHIQKLMFAFEVVEKPQRKQAQITNGADWGTQLPVEIGKWTGWLQTLIKAEPVEAWPADRCEMFLAQTEFIEQQRTAAKAKLQQV
jgi:hypothetical protein